ncbi:MAG: hypothetical protein AAF108_02190 [Planctomycetota bacterium]
MAAFGAALGVGVAWLAGCAPRARPAEPEQPLPPASELADAFNARIDGLDRLWARAVTSLTYLNADGQPAREQGDGHFMFVAPALVAHTIGGPDRTYIHFGSGEIGDGRRGGWLIDAVDKPVAYVVPEGASDAITVQGLRIDPARFLSLAGLRPIDAGLASIRRGSSPGTAWLDVPGRDGSVLSVEVRLGSAAPVRAEARDATGNLLLGSVLSDPARVAVRGGGRTPPVIPSKIEVTVPGDEGGVGSVRVSLSDPEINPRRPNARIFRLDVLNKTYGVEEVVDVSRPPVVDTQDQGLSEPGG